MHLALLWIESYLLLSSEAVIWMRCYHYFLHIFTRNTMWSDEKQTQGCLNWHWSLSVRRPYVSFYESYLSCSIYFLVTVIQCLCWSLNSYALFRHERFLLVSCLPGLFSSLRPLNICHMHLKQCSFSSCQQWIRHNSFTLYLNELKWTVLHGCLRYASASALYQPFLANMLCRAPAFCVKCLSVSSFAMLTAGHRDTNC